MGLFDLFKKKANTPSPAEEHYQTALALYQESKYKEVLSSLVDGFRIDINYAPLYELVINTLNALGGEEEAALFAAVQEQPGDLNALMNVGNYYFDLAHYDLALPFLEKSLSLDPQNEVVAHDIAIIYARRFQIEKALEVLRPYAKTDFWNYWFYCKLSLLNAETKGIEEGLDELMEVLDQERDQSAVAIPRQKVQEVTDALKRFESVKTPKQHVRDWHFIQYGGLILDFFENEEYVAGGRHVASWGSLENLRDIMERLKNYFEAFNIQFEALKYMPNRDAEIIGRALGMVLGLSVSPYHEQMPTANTLIVGAHASDFNGYEELLYTQQGQILFAMNQSWLEPAMICPECSALMSQSFHFPWEGGGFRVIDVEAGKFERTEADTRSAVEIAEELYQIKFEKEMDEASINFYKTHQDHLKMMNIRDGGFRYNFMPESPVPGSYFR
jgi:tetratricopeptide (TPR) repeat protein